MALNHSMEIKQARERIMETTTPLLVCFVFLFLPPPTPTLLGNIWVLLDIVNVKLSEVPDIFPSNTV